MSDISKIQLPDNSEYDIKDTIARAKGSIYYGTCTTAAETKDKVATVSSDQNFVLQKGTMVGIKFSNSNSYSATSENKITLNVNSTGALNIWYYNTNNTTGTSTAAYGVANVYNYYMYDGTYWVFAGRSADFNDGNYNLRFNAAIKAGTDDIVAGNLICANNSNLYYHLKKGTAFDIRWPIMYANSNITANNTGTNNYMFINFNVNTTQSMTLTAYKPVYIKGTLSGTIFTPISTTPLTQTAPSSADNYHYLYLGVAASTTNLYLFDYHPIYKYGANGFAIYEQTLAVNNILANTNLDTVKTVGFYYAGGNNNCTNMPSDYTGANNFGLEVIKRAIGDYYAQIYYPGVSAVTWIRICQSGTWGDWLDYTGRVYQSETTTPDWRKVILGGQNDSDPGVDPVATRSSVYVTPTIEVQPSTGTLRADNLLTTNLNGENVDELIEKVSDDLLIAEGNPITFETQSAQMAKETEVYMEPVQSFNGYDKPWIGGAGKNKWSLGDITTQQTGIAFSLPAGTYTCSCTPNGNQVVAIRFVYSDDSSDVARMEASNSYTATVTLTSAVVKVNTGLGTNTTATKVQVESGSSKTNYEPYENLCPISGRDNVEVVRCGKNFLEIADGFNVNPSYGNVNVTTNNNGEITLNGSMDNTNDSIGIWNLAWVGSIASKQSDNRRHLPNGTYKFNSSSFPTGVKIQILGSNTLDAGNTTADVKNLGDSNSTSITIDNTYKYNWLRLHISKTASFDNVTFRPMLYKSDITDTTYEEYQGKRTIIPFGSTIYGGTLNVETGELTDGWAIVDMGTLTYGQQSTGIVQVSKNTIQTVTGKNPKRAANDGSICDAWDGYTTTNNTYFYTDILATNFAAAASGHYLCFPLETPTTTTLTAAQVNLLKGLNNVYTDMNSSIKLTYREGSFATLEEIESVSELKNLAFKDKVDSEDMQPLFTNTYTGLIGSSNDADGAAFYCGTITPDVYRGIWKVHYRIYAISSGREDSKSYHEGWVDGTYSALVTYSNYNTIASTTYRPLYYVTLYRATETGINNGYGHLFGVGLYNAWNPTTAANARTVKIEILETINCTYTPWETPLKYASVPGTGSTNYSGLSQVDAYNNGLRETGDDNSYAYNVGWNYYSGKTSANIGIWNGSLCMQDASGNLMNICTASDGTVTTSNRTNATTKKANTYGFKVGSPIYYSSQAYNKNTNISDTSKIFSQYGTIFDSRYSFNTTLTAGSLTAYQPVYLVGTINSTDGLFYLDTIWWTQTPNDVSKVYVLVGRCYDSTTSNCRIVLDHDNPWYRYDGSKLVELINGHIIEDDVQGYIDITYEEIDLNDLYFIPTDSNRTKKYRCTDYYGAEFITNKPHGGVNDSRGYDVFTLEVTYLGDYYILQTYSGYSGVFERRGFTSSSGTSCSWQNWKTSVLLHNDRKVKNSYYGTTSTAASESTKIVTLSENDDPFVLQKGAIITVRFSNGNTANNVKLDVNGTGAKSITYEQSTISADNMDDHYVNFTGALNTFLYNGTDWVWISTSLMNTEGLYPITWKYYTSSNPVENTIYVADENGEYSQLSKNSKINILYPILFFHKAGWRDSQKIYNAINYSKFNFPVSNIKSQTLTQYLPIFVRGTLSGTIFTLDNQITDIITQTIPTTEDGKLYMRLGIATSTTHMTLDEDHRIYKYQNGAFSLYNG